MRGEILRILDANLNRSREGLRVCEDIARFILNSKSLTDRLKRVRHRISDIVKRLPSDSKPMVNFRDIKSDIGRMGGLIEDERARHDCADIFLANMERVKESLRVLEEFFKLVSKEISSEFETLRFNAYDIEKRALKKISSLRDLR